MSTMSASQRRNQSVVVLESTVPKPTPQLQIVVCPDWTTIILMMATLIFICIDRANDVAATGDSVSIHSWKQCDRAYGGNAIAFAVGEKA